MAPLLIPSLVTGLVVVTGTATTVHLALESGPFAPSSVAVLALGTVIATVVVTAGLLLARGRWSRRLGAVVVVGELGLVAVTGWGPWAAVAATAGATSTAGLAGRWLDGWVRARPSATGPEPHAVLLLLGLLSLIPAVGVAAPSGLETPHGVLGTAAVLLAWSYARAQPWSLWTIRLALPLIAAPAAAVSPWGGTVLLAVLTLAVVALGWSPQAMRSVRPFPDTLPSPRHPRRHRPEGDARETR